MIRNGIFSAAFVTLSLLACSGGVVPVGTESLSYTINLSGSLASPLLVDEVEAIYIEMKGAHCA